MGKRRGNSVGEEEEETEIVQMKNTKKEMIKTTHEHLEDDDEEHLEDDDEDDPEPEFLVTINSHVDCECCQFKFLAALQNLDAEIINFEAVNPITASGIAIRDFSPEDFQTKIEARFGKKIQIVVQNAICEVPDPSLELELDKDAVFSFCDSFVKRVPTSSHGSWGSLYQKTYRAVFKVSTKSEDTKDKFHGTAFLVNKTEKCSIFLSCAHTFRSLSDGTTISLVGSDFSSYKCDVVFCCSKLDFAILKVDCCFEGINPLVSCLGELSFGEAVYSVSTPVFQTPTEDELDDEIRVGTLWFPMCIGSVAHPWLVGVHPRNEKGEFLMLNIGGMITGASGAPILNAKGELIGIFLSCYTDPDTEESVSFALRISSVQDYLSSMLDKSDEVDPKAGEVIKCLMAGIWKKDGDGVLKKDDDAGGI